MTPLLSLFSPFQAYSANREVTETPTELLEAIARLDKK